MKLKKYISILAIFTISLSMVGCLKKSNIQSSVTTSSVEENLKQVQNSTNTLATDCDYVVYDAKSSDQYNNYSPLNVLDDDSNSSWVLNDKYGKGIGEWIQINFDKEVQLDKFYIVNGLGWNGDNNESYLKNNRVKTLEVEFSNGEKQEINLEDNKVEEQEIALNKSIKTDYVKFTIKDIYEGNERPNLTCIGSIGINYPRINGNEDEPTNFIGIYGDYSEENGLSRIVKYIDYKNGMLIEQKVQYLANVLVDILQYQGENIKISEDKNDKLTAKLNGENLISCFRDSTCDGVIEKALIESNLLQYYYEGNDWIDNIQLDYGEKVINVTNENFKKEFLDNKDNYNYLIDKKIDEKVPSQASDNQDNNKVNYTFEEAFYKTCEYLKNTYGYNGNYILSQGLEKVDLTVEEFENGDKKTGYVLPISPKSEDGGMTCTSYYFVDAYTGYIYNYDSVFITEILSK